VHGGGMGLVSYTGRGRWGSSQCEGTEWESETSVRCLVGHGARGTRRVVMTAGDRFGSLSTIFSFDLPAVSVSLGRNSAGTGSVSFTLVGSGLGLSSWTGRVVSGSWTRAESSEWSSETSVLALASQGSALQASLALWQCKMPA